MKPERAGPAQDRGFAVARITAVGAVAAVVSGWGVGQYPWMLVDEVRIADAAGASATLSALPVATGLAVVLVLPALAYLFVLTQSWSRAPAEGSPPERPDR